MKQPVSKKTAAGGMFIAADSNFPTFKITAPLPKGIAAPMPALKKRTPTGALPATDGNSATTKPRARVRAK